MNEQFYNTYHIRTDTQGRIIRGFSNAFEQPQDGDILINEQGEGTQFRLTPGGRENPWGEMFTDDGIPLLRWDASSSAESEPWRGITARSPQEIEDDRIAIESSPAKQIAIYSEKVRQGIPKVLAHMYDILSVMVQCMDANEAEQFKAALESIMPDLSAEEFELVQVEGEPNSTGKSQWRKWMSVLESLMEEANNA